MFLVHKKVGNNYFIDVSEDWPRIHGMEWNHLTIYFTIPISPLLEECFIYLMFPKERESNQVM